MFPLLFIEKIISCDMKTRLKDIKQNEHDDNSDSGDDIYIQSMFEIKAYEPKVVKELATNFMKDKF